MGQPYPSASRELGPARQQSVANQRSQIPAVDFDILLLALRIAANQKRSQRRWTGSRAEQSRAGKRSRCVTSLRPPTSPLQQFRHLVAFSFAQPIAFVPLESSYLDFGTSQCLPRYLGFFHPSPRRAKHTRTAQKTCTSTYTSSTSSSEQSLRLGLRPGRKLSERLIVDDATWSNQYGVRMADSVGYRDAKTDSVMYPFTLRYLRGEAATEL
ncbi:hypothetical protein TgHK011_007382 [Trichoderma gracile]|nr:hypothetical protein TgHK011_007382 [Trichoderma gracile]